jgi:choice-of-anchor A domain-containing protein/uncharacterized repeat protein (TIGR01451 family)
MMTKRFLTVFLLVFTIGIYAQTITYKTLGTWNSDGVPNYLEPARDNIDNSLLVKLQASLPEGQNLTVHHPQYLATGAQTNIALLEEADVWVTFVSEGAGYKNALGFYTYDKNNPPSSISDIQNTMTLIFPNTSLTGSGGGLTAGDKVKIGHFQANTVIGFFLVADGWRNNSVGNGNWLLFSNSNLNPEPDASIRQHNVLLNDDVTGKVILGFEDIRRDNSSCDFDFNDVLYYITANPYKAIDTTGIPPIDNKKADLSLVKSVDNSAPKNGDVVTYTLTVANHGPENATGVAVTDKLPAGLTYVASIPSQGNYDTATGIWAVGTINNGNTATLRIQVRINSTAVSSGAFNLGAATGFNLFVLNDLNQPSSDTEGKVAVGRDAFLSNYSVGDKLPNSNGSADALVVGRNLTYRSGAVYNGNVVYGNESNLPQDQVSVEGTVRKGNPIDFAAAQSYLQNLSNTLNDYAITDTATFIYGELKLKGNNPFLNVFRINGSDLSKANNFVVDVPNGSVALINIDGESVSWTGGLVINGTDKSNILYNFNQTTTLKIQGIDVRGSILAPFADVNFVSGVQNGQMIAKNVGGAGQFNQGQFNNTLFVGNIPVNPQIVNIAEISAEDQKDPDSAPNNGVVTEDDYSSATLTVNNYGASSTGTSSWNHSGSIAGEIVNSMSSSSNGAVIAGTMSGNIYRANGQSWDKISGALDAEAVWTTVTVNDNLFAGTDKGIFTTVDDGKNWTNVGLEGMDVRSVVVDKAGNMFAAAWGKGVYVSNDKGATWKETNNGLGCLEVQALAVDNGGALYAGTFGGGVFKYESAGGQWVNTNLGYNFIWSLNVTANGCLFAGAYGAGTFALAANAKDWKQTNNGLEAKYIYSVTSDKKGNVYANSFEGGVYATSDNGNSWKLLGMEGQKVSSIFFDPAAEKVLAASGSGAIFESVNGVTAVNEVEAMPANFELKQNYPNPFNPSTIISFNIAESGLYSMKIFNILGQEVASLFNKELTKGIHQVRFDAGNLSSGVYIYKLTGKNISSVKKMMLQK